jgi:hypothetical protein
VSEQDAEIIPVDPERPDAVPVVEDDESPAHPGEPADPNEDTEPAEPIEPDDDDEPDEPTEDQSQGKALSEQEIDKRGQKLGAENVRHAKRVSEIMADDAPDLIPCPVCMDGIAGWVFLPEVAQLPPEAITRIRQLIGLPDLTTYDQAKFATQCPDCHGMGEVKTGSLVNGYEVTTCETCQKQGWVRTTAYGTNGGAAANVAPIVTGPMVAGPEQPDPEIAHLRERGFTVIPPMTVPVNA